MSVNITRLLTLSKVTKSSWCHRSKYLASYVPRRNVQEFPGLRFDNALHKDYVLVLPEAINQDGTTNEVLRVPRKGEAGTDFTKLSPEAIYKGVSQTICAFENLLTDLENDPLPPGTTSEQIFQRLEEKLYPMDFAFHLFMVLLNIDSSAFRHIEFHQLIERYYAVKDKRFEGLIKEVLQNDFIKRQSKLTGTDLEAMLKLYHIGEAKKQVIKTSDDGHIFYFKKNLHSDTRQFIENYNEANRLFSHTVDDPDILKVVAEELGDCQDLHHKERTPLQITVHTYPRFMQVCPDRFVRQMLWQTYNKRCSPKSVTKLNNLRLIGGMRVDKRKISDFLGYRSYVDYKMRETTVESKAEILDTFKMLNSENKPKLMERLQELNDYAADNNFEDPNQLGIQEYDVDYWTHKYMHDILIGVKEADLKAYFPLDAVLGGVQKFFKSHFGIEISRTKDHGQKFWSHDVELLEVKKNGEQLGKIIFDPYERPLKTGPQVFYARVQSRHEDYLPCRLLCASYKKDNQTNKANLSFADVSDLFMSFGIVVQRLLYKYKYYELNTYGGLERDAAHILPNLCTAYLLTDHKILQSCSDRGQSKPIDSELAKKIISASVYFNPFKTYDQLYRAHLDLEIHSVLSEAKEIARNLYEIYAPFNRSPDNYDFCAMAGIIVGPNDGLQYVNLRSKQMANYCLNQITGGKSDGTSKGHLEMNTKLIESLFDPEKFNTKEKLVSLFGPTFEPSKTGLGVL